MGKIIDSVDQRIRLRNELVGARDPEPSEARIAQMQRDREDYDGVRAAVETLADLANRHTSNDDLLIVAMIEQLLRTHRYIQNDLIVKILTVLGTLGGLYEENEVRYADARNGFAMKLCGKVREALKDELFFRETL
jgi:hypothetical protein